MIGLSLISQISRGNLAINKLTPYIFPPAYMDRGINIEYAAQFKKALHVPVSVVGAVTLEQAEEAIASGKVDMVALCRQLIAEAIRNRQLEDRAGLPKCMQTGCQIEWQSIGLLLGN